MHGTAAEKLQYDVYEENKVLKKKKKQRSNNKAKFNVVFSILVIFALGSFAMYRYVQITDMNYKIDRTLTEYNEIRDENNTIKVRIENKLDLKKIEDTAKRKLGMQKPDAHQITYIKVPRYDFTVVSEEAKAEKEINSNVFGMLKGKVNRLLKMLY